MIPIKDFESHLINIHGDVFSARSKRRLNPSLTKKGYLRVHITCNKVETHFFIHRLIAIHFIPNPENKPFINHINGIKTDNRIENLEWVTNQENIIHAYKNGLIKIARGKNKKSSIKVVNSITNEIFECIGDAAKSVNMNRDYLASMLRGEKNNNTNFIYYKT